MSNTITPTVFYRTLNMEGLEIFYREAGPRDAPTVAALARLSCVFSYVPQSDSHAADKYHVVAPTSMDMAKAQHRRSTISTIPTNG
jgi:hypothetical protein